MVRVTRRRSASVRCEALESRCLLNADPGMWPLANPTPSNTLLVRFADHAPASAVRGAVEALGGYLGTPFPDGPSRLVLGFGLDPAAAAAALRGHPFVLDAEPDALVAAAATPNDPNFGSEWGLNQPSDIDIDAPAAWDTTTGGSATVVAVTDTGLDYTHPDLYLNVWLNPGEIPAATQAALIDTNGDGRLDFYDLNSLDAGRGVVRDAAGSPVNVSAASDRNGNGYIDAGDLLADPAWADARDDDGDGYKDDLIGWNYVAGTADPYDDNSHGTHVSGTIAATSNNGVGVAGIDWNARIMPLKFLNATGGGSISDAVAAINLAARLGARVINASWGGAPYTQALSDAIAAAGAKGAVFVAAAGNNATSNDATPFYPASYRLSNEVAVAAINATGALADFSDYGASTVDLGAPGQSIYSTIPGGYAYKSGTSMAAPHVAGVAALLAGQHPELTAAQLVGMVAAGTKPLAGLAGKTTTGGLVDAALALAAASPPPAPPASPSNLTASAASSGAIQLAWTGPAEATGYKVFRSPDGATGWVPVGTTAAGTTSFTDSGLAASTRYSYEVVATGPGGDSAPSNVAAATTAAATTKKGRAR